MALKFADVFAGDIQQLKFLPRTKWNGCLHRRDRCVAQGREP